MPVGYEYMIEWFWELRSFCNGIDDPVTPRAVLEWSECVGNLLSHWEKATLIRMDRVFRITLSDEIAYNERRLAEKAKR